MSRVKVGDLCMYDHSGSKTEVLYRDLVIVLDLNFNCRFVSSGYNDRATEGHLVPLSQEECLKAIDVLEKASQDMLSSIRFLRNELLSRGLSLNERIAELIESPASTEIKAKAIELLATSMSSINFSEMSKVSSSLREFIDPETIVLPVISGARETISVVNAASVNTGRVSRRNPLGHLPGVFTTGAVLSSSAENTSVSSTFTDALVADEFEEIEDPSDEEGGF